MGSPTLDSFSNPAVEVLRRFFDESFAVLFCCFATDLTDLPSGSLPPGRLICYGRDCYGTNFLNSFLALWYLIPLLVVTALVLLELVCLFVHLPCLMSQLSGWGVYVGDGFSQSLWFWEFYVTTPRVGADR